MLKVTWSLLCRRVEKSPDGIGNNFLGVVENYHAEHVPYEIDQMTVVLRVESSESLLGVFEIKIIHGGRTVLRTDPKIRHLTVYDPHHPILIKTISIKLGRIILPTYGEYSVATVVNDMTIHTSSFRLLQRKAPINGN
jgi:hypothetical protein